MKTYKLVLTVAELAALDVVVKAYINDHRIIGSELVDSLINVRDKIIKVAPCLAIIP